jgi:cytoskeleton protein RodZ
MNNVKDDMSIEKNTELQNAQGPGHVLVRAREALSITQAETADVLNLSVRVIKALENNDDTALPERVYVNGYIRSYAKLLGLAAEPLIQSWGAQFPDETQSQRVDNEEAEALNWSVATAGPNANPRLGRWVLVAVVLSFVFIYFVSNRDGVEVRPGSEIAPRANKTGSLPAWQDSNIQALSEENVLVEQQEESNAVLAVPVIEGGSGDAQNNQTLPEADFDDIVAPPDLADTVEPDVESEPTIEAASDEVAMMQLQDFAAGNIRDSSADNLYEAESAPEAIGNESSELAQTVAAEEGSAPRAFSLPRLTLTGDDQINLAFTEDCWFEIRASDGEMLHADLGRSEQTREYYGQGPFAIKLGFAPGATVTFNGQSIALEEYTRNGMANLLLGKE